MVFKKKPTSRDMAGFIGKIRPQELTGTYLSYRAGVSYSAIYKYNSCGNFMPEDVFQVFLKILKEEVVKLQDYIKELENE